MVRRRGKPEVMISDNGTNFISADKELRDLVSNLDQTKIKEQATNEFSGDLTPLADPIM